MAVTPMLAAAAEQVAGGGYISIWKIIPPLVLLLIWAKLMTWADKDAPVAHLPRDGINLGMLLGLVIAYALFFLLPNYWIALAAIVVILGAEVGTYLTLRSQKVGMGDLKGQFQDWLSSLGGKKKEVKAVQGQVMLFGKEGAVPPPAGDAPERPAYDAAQMALTDALKKSSEQIDIDGRAESGVMVKYIVDGVPYTGQVIERSSGAAAIGYLKGIAGLDVEDRRKPQTGSMKLGLDGKKQEARVQTAGSTAGEYMRLIIEPKKRHLFKLDGLGFSEKQLEVIKESIRGNKGLVILSTPKQMGLTSLGYGMLRGHDAFLEHIQTVEREVEDDLDGITQNKLAPNAPAAEEYKTADWVISQEPDVILINKVEDSRTAVDLIKYAKTGKRVYVCMRADSTFDALNQWRKLVGDDNLAVEALEMVINGRVLRTLCSNCKVGYAPDQGTLRKLGMNPEKVTQLFQARTQPMRDPKGNPIPCQFCHDLHFKGRSGVFEIMPVNDEMREAIVSGKAVEQAFRKQRGRFLQEEALGMVEQGETSVQEVKRVLKPGVAVEGEPTAPAPAVPRVAGKVPAARPSGGAAVR